MEPRQMAQLNGNSRRQSVGGWTVQSHRKLSWRYELHGFDLCVCALETSCGLQCREPGNYFTNGDSGKRRIVHKRHWSNAVFRILIDRDCLLYGPAQAATCSVNPASYLLASGYGVGDPSVTTTARGTAVVGR